ncbi:leucine-rich repeat domain-containing protein [Mangrovimonas xylaniphaga]|uniref:leucine-rich repeat domain-containing protein n=1 Tax=Mangrovimonas xylaniphaga TaxID=1645915 RepID=UPI0006B4E2EB|nr:leucine-rich repeat domain-containing protein [Mangrovimonas xylaniphaga]
MTNKDIEIGFWRFNDGFWPSQMSIEDIDIYKTERLVVELSTLNKEIVALSATKKRELRRVWSETLPKLDNVKYLMTTHQIDQSFFDSICQMQNLEGLYIKWGKVESLDSISNLTKLKHLHFGSNPRLKSIEGISKLSQLETLELENFQKVEDFNKLSSLIKLQCLDISTSMDGPRIKINDLEFLKNLTDLKVLILDISLKSKDFNPILNLEKLVKLWVPDNLIKPYNKKDLRTVFKNIKYGNLIE